MYIIAPSDRSTDFLKKSLMDFRTYISNGHIKIIECNADIISYSNARLQIDQIPNGSSIIFMGHGLSDKLYGGESDTFKKQALLNIQDFSKFKNKKIYCFSCFSSSLLSKSHNYRTSLGCLGFGIMPTEMQEIRLQSSLSSLSISEENIEYVKNLIINIIKSVISEIIKGSDDSEDIYYLVKSILLSEINKTALTENNFTLSELIFHIYNDIYYD